MDRGRMGDKQADNAVDEKTGHEKSLAAPAVGKVADHGLQQATAEGEDSGDQSQGKTRGAKSGGEDRKDIV